MKGFLEEFKAFAMRGNVMDLAVAVVIGTAFGKIVSSLVANIVMPAISLIIGGIDLSDLVVTIRSVEITYGVFLQAVVDFLIIALVIFVAVKLTNTFFAKEKKKEEKGEKAPPEDIMLLREIRDALKK